MDQYIYNLGSLFVQNMEKFSDNCALCTLEGKSVTYSNLHTRSNQYANYLLDKNIQKNQLVALFHNKSFEAYALMIACLKIGAPYTNLDPNSPSERLSKMISISDPSIFFCPAEWSYKLNEVGYNKQKVIDYTNHTSLEEINKYPFELDKIDYDIPGNTPAYLMFTSGSTGFPKGVVISHANILNFIHWSVQTYQSNPTDVFTNVNPMHFDNSVFDFYASLFTGASLIPVPEEVTKNPRKLILALNELNPTIWFSVPSMLVYMLKLRALNTTDLPKLRIITFGGEGFPKAQLRVLWKLIGHRVTFINVYGPTECTCICSSYIVNETDLESDELLPLGPLAPNFYFTIIDNSGKEIKNGEVGELCIAGLNVGLGYYNNPEKTREVFIQNPASDLFRDIVYKSGDLVKYDETKNLLYFCGRKDNQIKRMGYRIELEEIEASIGSLDYVEENAVIYNKTDDTNGKIVAFLHSKMQNESDIFEELKNKLPQYMIPNEIIFYDHLPKNQNGKIDRLQLKDAYQRMHS